ncbi:hypothetical protein CSW38_11420 [Thermus scotoductus]|uniref:Type 4 fimbrial biogenesis protein PilX N-terminal domain-containing protein n=1 Tax=Thermus scotoductus TaxID=37636 RepID=A0A430UEC4_THESC|nr:hypothetical protein CSW51_12030 [Thermus scotoductus]RTH03708.1 hypothetical protein CSW47_08130 [Thermus scotoductus]RTH23120.1 hypothetical protein CSW38_11420 [Thermus scotoductus]RTH97139.1 hypothetical protein CSW29_11945 [Thermus scotoductus]
MVLMVVLTALLAAMSYTVLGAFKGSAVERRAYQAFLLAESALDAFPSHVLDSGCATPPPEEYTLPIRNGDTLKASYEYSGLVTRQSDNQKVLPKLGTITVRTVASYAGATARVERQYNVSCGIVGAIPAALTSRPSIEVSGNARLEGEDFDSSTGLIPRNFPQDGVTQVSLPSGVSSLTVPLSGTFTLNVADASLIPDGGYIQIPTGGTPKTYRVMGKSGNTLTLDPIFTPTSTDVILSQAPVGVVEYGIQSLSGNTLTLADTRGLVPGQAIRVKDKLGTISSIQGNEITVTWSSGAPDWNNQTDKGTPLVAQVAGAASHLSIQTSGSNAQVVNGSFPNSDLVPGEANELFQRVFGVPKEVFQRLYPPSPSTSFTGTLSGWELKVISNTSTQNFTLCGQGILVVFGNFKVNNSDSCNAGFQGLLYVAGDYEQRGNAVITGAVVAEGNADINCESQECISDIRGTGQGGGKITYDPWVLYRLKMASEGKLVLAPVPGSWRRL